MITAPTILMTFCSAVLFRNWHCPQITSTHLPTQSLKHLGYLSWTLYFSGTILHGKHTTILEIFTSQSPRIQPTRRPVAPCYPPSTNMLPYPHNRLSHAETRKKLQTWTSTLTGKPIVRSVQETRENLNFHLRRIKLSLLD